MVFILRALAFGQQRLDPVYPDRDRACGQPGDFADLGQTLAENFGVGPLKHGTSFLDLLVNPAAGDPASASARNASAGQGGTPQRS